MTATPTPRPLPDALHGLHGAAGDLIAAFWATVQAAGATTLSNRADLCALGYRTAEALVPQDPAGLLALVAAWPELLGVVITISDFTDDPRPSTAIQLAATETLVDSLLTAYGFADLSGGLPGVGSAAGAASDLPEA